MPALTWSLLRESAVFLLAGFLVAALAEALLAGGRLARRLARPGGRSVALAALVGIPLPLCSCSVLPAALTLRRHGASRGATLAFLVSTPETSITSILLTWGLLGPLMAVVRPVAAGITAVVAGLLGNLVEKDADGAPPASPAPPGGPLPGSGAEGSAGAACCADSCGAGPGPGSSGPRETPASGTPPSPASAPPGAGRLAHALRYAFVDLFDDVVPWVVVGILVAAAIGAWLPPEVLAGLGRSWLALLVMLVVGVPLYVCAEASTPVAAALVAGGLSPGAALVFLLAGPATNLGSLGALRAQLGGRTVAAYLLAIGAVSLAAGATLDLILGEGTVAVREQALHATILPAWLENGAATLFLLLGTGTLARRWKRRRG